MESSIYDPCLFFSSVKDKLGVVQKDHTLIVCGPNFADKEDKILSNAGFRAKEKEKLAADKPTNFNDCILSIVDQKFLVRQKKQGEKLSLIDLKDERHASDRCGQIMYPKEECRAHIKCQNGGRPQRSDSQKCLARPAKAGYSTKELQEIRIAG